jgi:hypothetical protein
VILIAEMEPQILHFMGMALQAKAHFSTSVNGLARTGYLT